MPRARPLDTSVAGPAGQPAQGSGAPRKTPSASRRSAPNPTAEAAALDPRLARYRDKRRFDHTPEPDAFPAAAARTATTTTTATTTGPRFVVQKHWASQLHYDFRLEHDGVLWSWALPKGLSYDPLGKRIAIRTEDHPLAYADFEGVIPPGAYGAGRVIVWDRGHWTPEAADPQAALEAGKLIFTLHGHKLAGRWELVRIAKPGDRSDAWMLFKKRDAWARAAADYDVLSAWPDALSSHPLPLLVRDAAGPETKPAAQAASRSRTGAIPDTATAGRPAASRRRAATPSPAEAAEPAGAARHAADLPGAQAAALPELLAPQLAVATARAPEGPGWRYELKFDGYRILTRLDAEGRARLFTRNGHDWTDRMPELARAMQALGRRNSWLDGEIVVLDAQGLPDFNALQNALDGGRASAAIRCFLFDLPFAEGHDLRATPWSARRALLQSWMAAHAAQGTEHEADPRLRFSAEFAADPASLLESARALGLEGLIAKKADAPYVSRRSESWLKLKLAHEQELIVAGYTERSDGPGQVGSLVLGVHEADGRLRHAGSVGTGWDAATATALFQALQPLRQGQAPFAAGAPGPGGRWARRVPGSEQWLRPERLVRVRFAGWTPDGHVRHAVFQALREDKAAEAIHAEPSVGEASPNADDTPSTQAQPMAVPSRPTRRRAAASAGPVASAPPLAISNPQRVIDPSTGLTKLDLVRYYDSVAEHLLPHLAGRPASLVRAPEGVSGPQFFQKHDEAGSIPGLRVLPQALWPEHAPLIEVPDAAAVRAAAQMNVIEFHTWNARSRKIDAPDRIVFDLDPGEGVPFDRVREGALLTRTLLEELGLRSWLKTSGGKGLHVVVPIATRWSFDTVKALAQAAVVHLAQTIPQRFVAKSGPANRVGKIFVDYLRNSHGATTAAAFSARARPGLGVSMPVDWAELSTLKGGDHWTIATARDHLSFQTTDPWADFFSSKQTLTPALRRLGLPARPPEG